MYRRNGPLCMPSTKAEMKPNPQTCPQGSEWRRWDLHIHSPASALESQFAGWDEYVDALEKAGKGVSGLGVTDYCAIEGYKKILEYQGGRRLGQFDLVLPNIEFRIQPETPDGRAINIHILVSPEDPKHVEKIEQALAKLTFKYKGNPYSCKRDELISLGKAHDPAQKDDDAAFKGGVNVFKPSFDTFRDWYIDNEWLRTNSLVVIANSKDGASGLSKDAGFAAQREELYRFAQIVFSGNPKDREYFLGKGTDSESEVLRKCGSLKPCIHGSDAHQESKLFEPDQQRYCWIKADPTFEGLRQILYEQQDRVYIGPTPPAAIDESKIIDSVVIAGAPKWFSSPEVRLNPGLVAIIGEKGSGKTALVDLVAYATSGYAGEGRSSSFIEKANPYLDGVSVKIKWRDGELSTASLDAKQPDALPRVRYLSQDFVEELCSKDTSGAKLVQEIEDVVFSYIDESERLEASSFEELRRLKTEHLSAKRDNLRAQISKLNSEIVKLEDLISSKSEKEKQRAKADEEIAAIDKQLPSLQGSVNKEIAEKLSKEKETLKVKQKELGETNKLLGRIQTLRSAIDDYRNEVETGYEVLAEVLREVGIAEADVVRFQVKLPPSFDVPVNRREDDLRKAAANLKGDPKKPVKDGQSIADVEARIAELEKTVAVDTKERERLLALEKQKVKLQTERDRLVKEIKDIDTIHGKTLTAKREDRWKAYLESFRLMGKEKHALEELYKPLDEVLSVDPSGAKLGFELNVKQTPNMDEWLETGRNLIDQRKRPFGEKEFRKALDKELARPWSDGDEAEIRIGLQRILDYLSEGTEMNGVLVSHTTRLQLYDWAFSTDHVHLDYGLKYQGTELTLLSPGTRGIVLLVLYLEMDRNDRRPLIIDQPEGNLDNSSIYESLVPYLRRAKKDRQIILVTHNPNLVVAADADQVIVASAHKKANEPHPLITYKSGSLEDSKGKESIREFVCRLLEGGRRAFKVRENKYSLGAEIE